MEYVLKKNVKIIDVPKDIEDLWDEVVKEANYLKQHATEEELERLKTTIAPQVNGEDYDSCIYGIMTGSCYNERATELIIDLPTITSIRNKPETYRGEKMGRRIFTGFYTPIEQYIMPIEDDDYNEDYDGEDDSILPYTDAYYRRVDKVLELFK